MNRRTNNKQLKHGSVAIRSCNDNVMFTKRSEKQINRLQDEREERTSSGRGCKIFEKFFRSPHQNLYIPLPPYTY